MKVQNQDGANGLTLSLVSFKEEQDPYRPEKRWEKKEGKNGILLP